VDQEQRPVLDFWRCAMLPLRDQDRRTGHADELASVGRPADTEDAAELPGLASAVVATAQQFGPARCRSAAECFQLTRDVEDTVQLMIATLRAPERLDRDRVAPWLERAGRTSA